MKNMSLEKGFLNENFSQYEKIVITNKPKYSYTDLQNSDLVIVYNENNPAEFTVLKDRYVIVARMTDDEIYRTVIIPYLRNQKLDLL